MKSGYDQFFKSAKNAANGKPASVKLSPNKSAHQISKSKMQQKKKRGQAQFPLISFIICVIGFCGAYAGFENYESLGALLGKVEISLFSPANASADEVKKEGNSANASNEMTTFTKPIVAEPTGEELNHLMRLSERKKELDAREEELNRMESEMSKQKDELQKKVSELEKMRNSISTILEERVKGDDQKIETLVQFYSNMKATQAAKIFETLDEDLGVQLIGRMKKKNAAEILNLMKPEKAQMFTEKFAGYKRTVASKPGSTQASPEGDTTDDSRDAQQSPTKP
jgi:flagellar motility protein MotE (MotC chaperone)